MYLQVLKSIDAKQLFGLLNLFLKKPWFAIPTITATIECMKISEREFGNLHHLHNKANAFRHALWNLLIAISCLKWSNNVEDVLKWTTKITTWHEHFSPNLPLAMAMDLHNYSMGRKLFYQLRQTPEDKLIEFLKDKTQVAEKIISPEEINNFEDKLVYIED